MTYPCVGPATVAARKVSAAMSTSDIEALLARLEKLREIVRMITDEKALAALESLIEEAEAQIAELDKPEET